MSSGRTIKSRNWLLTVNNPADNELLFSDRVQYATWQLEKGEEGTPHLQLYIQFKQNSSLGQVKKEVPRSHCEIAKHPVKARMYCRKADTRVAGPWEFGKFTGGQGRRTDWDALKEDCKSNKPITEIVETHFQLYCQYTRGIEKARRHLCVKKRDWKMEVIAIFGPSRVGKTTYAKNKWKDAYWKTQDKWWDGYNGEKVTRAAAC